MRIDLIGRSDQARKIGEALKDMDRRFGLGDLTPKKYARVKQDLLAQLGRSIIAPFLEAGESVTSEHHWTEGQRELPDSPFKETAQVAGSLYATQLRIFRWQFRIYGPPLEDPQDGGGESLEFRWYGEISGLEKRRSTRWGEAVAGAVIGFAALLLRGHLSVTGFVLMGVGAFGIAHALLLPTRWASLAASDPAGEPWAIYATGTRSGCAMLKELRGRLPVGGG